MDLQVLYDLLKDVRVDQQEHGKELAHQSNTLVAIQKDVEVNTRDLTEHKEGVIQNKEANSLLREELHLIQAQLEKEIEQLKEPSKFKAWLFSKTTKWLALIASISGIAATLFKILGIW